MSWIEDYGDDYYEGFYMKNLGRDTAYLNVTNEEGLDARLFKKHKECIECDYHYYTSIFHNHYIVSTKYQYQIKVNREVLCDIDNLGEFGIYNVVLNKNSCDLSVAKEPVNIYLPIITVSLFLTVLFSILLLWFLCNKYNKNGTDEPTTKGKSRIKALDTFRGVCIVIMIFVNLGAGGYAIFDHAVWNGLHLADLVFPWFLWIMGTCMPLSIASSSKNGVTKHEQIKNTTKRAVKLFCVGIFLNSGVYLESFRYFAVLQRFSIAYFVVSMILIFTTRNDESIKSDSVCRDLLALAWGWMVIILIGAAHAYVTFFVADEGCPRGYLGPGGYHKHGMYKSCTGGATGYIDRHVMVRHTFSYPTCREAYNSLPFDPEGILGCLNTIVQVFIGVQAGTILLKYQNHRERISRWLLWALLTLLCGGTLSGFSIENGFIPINKNLWSLSFVMVTSGLAFLLLAAVYYFTDCEKKWNGSPFFYPGMNSIFLFVGHQIAANYFPFAWAFQDKIETHFLLLFQNVTATIIWVMISIYLYKIKFFLVI